MVALETAQRLYARYLAVTELTKLETGLPGTLLDPAAETVRPPRTDLPLSLQIST